MSDATGNHVPAFLQTFIQELKSKLKCKFQFRKQLRKKNNLKTDSKDDIDKNNNMINAKGISLFCALKFKVQKFLGHRFQVMLFKQNTVK